MSETTNDCRRFDQWLGDNGRQEDAAWRDHLGSCPSCRAQEETHRLLVAAFADQPVPELSTSFDAALERRLRAAVTVRPLAGWRRAALVAYALAAGGLLAWLLRDVSLAALRPGASWLGPATLAAVPLTLLLAAALSKLLPARGLERLSGAARGLSMMV